MCGIAGFISKEFGDQDLQKMACILQHRGPDAKGFYYDATNSIGLAHRRLSILDLSEAANQPFYSRDGRYVMIYNGEVYNFKEVAAKYNIDAFTTSDSEIIIEAFAKAGMRSIQDLNGMFSIVIWDKVNKKLSTIIGRKKTLLSPRN
jgi:asparagine synthase (glutamine-hydrolysing)